MNLSISPKFKKRYDSSPVHIRRLFDRLIQDSQQYYESHKPTDTPDYRLVNRGVFCLITLPARNEVVRVNLKTQGLGLRLSSVTLQIIQKDRHAEGNERMEFEINQENQLPEAIRLIKIVSDRICFLKGGK